MKFPEIRMIDNIAYLTEKKVEHSLPQITILDEYTFHKPHPLECEAFVYERLCIGKISVDDSLLYRSFNRYSNKHEESAEQIMYMVKDYLRDPAIQWAVMRSADGIYLTKQEDHATMRTCIRMYVYLDPKNISFWNLKYSNHTLQMEY